MKLPSVEEAARLGRPPASPSGLPDASGASQCQALPDAWHCGTAHYASGDGCGCDAPDPACDGKTIEDCECSAGTCDASAFDDRHRDCAAIDPGDLRACVAWTCGNGVVEGPERCDPPDGTSCDAANSHAAALSPLGAGVAYVFID